MCIRGSVGIAEDIRTGVQFLSIKAEHFTFQRVPDGVGPVSYTHLFHASNDEALLRDL